MENIKYYDLTLSQDVMYFALKYSPKKSVVNIGAALWIEEEIDIDLLEKALYKSIWRMDALRLRLKKVDGVIKQYVSTEEPKKVNDTVKACIITLIVTTIFNQVVTFLFKFSRSEFFV